MKRYIPHAKKNPTPWYRCTTRNCDCKMVKCEVAETEIRHAMQEWLEEYRIRIEAGQPSAIDPIDTALETVRGQLASLQLQQENICEYLEKGIYTVEMFTKRSNALSKEIKQLQSSEADLLRQRGEGNQKRQAAAEIIPTTQHILDSYSMLSTEEKNRLWKLVMKKATVYRTPEGEMTIHIYPNLPK